jgi:hypothetical protein
MKFHKTCTLVDFKLYSDKIYGIDSASSRFINQKIFQNDPEEEINIELMLAILKEINRHEKLKKNNKPLDARGIQVGDENTLGKIDIIMYE